VTVSTSTPAAFTGAANAVVGSSFGAFIMGAAAMLVL
jgi:hypothetical protein